MAQDADYLTPEGLEVLAMAAKRWTLEHTESNAAILKLDMRYGETFRVLLSGDRHHDNPKTDWELEAKHLDVIKKCGGAVIDCGDLFCAMAGIGDPRSNKTGIREIHKVDNYLDSLVRHAADFYEPYAEQFAAIGVGNHETSVYKRHETDLLSRLVERLNDRAKTNIQRGGYRGFVRVHVKTPIKRTVSTVIAYAHGWSPNTDRNVFNSIGNADIFFTGHTHQIDSTELCRTWCNNARKIKTQTVHVVKTSTYKDEFETGASGWHVETGKTPRPLGAWYADLTLRSNKEDKVEHLEIAITRAN